MEVLQVKMLKIALEDDLSALIRKFELHTDATVSSINHCFCRELGKEKKTERIKLEVSI